MQVSKGSVDDLRHDVNRLSQPLRVVLLGFTVLKELYLGLKREQSLTELPKKAVPALLSALKATLPAEKWCAPQISAPAAQVRTELQTSLHQAIAL